MTHTVWAAAAAGMVATTMAAANLSAQARPDFSGRWTREPDSTALAQPAGGRQGGGAVATLGSGWGSDITITQDANRLTVEYLFFARTDMQPPIKYAYALDGTTTRNAIMMGHGIQELRSSTRWNDATLVITTEQTIPDPAGSGAAMRTEVKQSLSLTSATSMVVETTRAGVMGGAPSSTRTIYRRM